MLLSVNYSFFFNVTLLWNWEDSDYCRAFFVWSLVSINNHLYYICRNTTFFLSLFLLSKLAFSAACNLAQPITLVIWLIVWYWLLLSFFRFPPCFLCSVFVFLVFFLLHLPTLAGRLHAIVSDLDVGFCISSTFWELWLQLFWVGATESGKLL